MNLFVPLFFMQFFLESLSRVLQKFVFKPTNYFVFLHFLLNPHEGFFQWLVHNFGQSRFKWTTPPGQETGPWSSDNHQSWGKSNGWPSPCPILGNPWKTTGNLLLTTPIIRFPVQHFLCIWFHAAKSSNLQETTSWEVHIFPEHPVVISHPIWTIRLHKSLKHFHFFLQHRICTKYATCEFQSQRAAKIVWRRRCRRSSHPTRDLVTMRLVVTLKSIYCIYTSKVLLIFKDYPAEQKVS